MPAITTQNVGIDDLDNVLYDNVSGMNILTSGFGISSGSWQYSPSSLNMTLSLQEPSTVLQYFCADIQCNAHAINQQGGLQTRLYRNGNYSNIFRSIPISNNTTSIVHFHTWNGLSPGNHTFRIQFYSDGDSTGIYRSKHIVLVLKN